MADELDQLVPWAADLLAKMQPVARRQLTRQIAMQLRKSQVQRIAEQQNPDGSPYTPRNATLRKKKGRIRRSMFQKLRNARHLKADSDANEARVGFTGRDAMIASQHQEGMPKYRLPSRHVLGFSREEQQWIEGVILDFLAAR
ncbi:phage virion morphogenesis protein [Silvimonas terrae]|uniref:Phage virion morphogenesis protein n=1 Tax=Silvimonas terrae TaxID=300266 RepID=A0A840RI12_9NEIS|nr:phage virion morphogenesis protein [Silvimonas terrae]MBB5192080.1 phage virion morphogenesis protein [Silvimonas terrae]